MLISLHINEGVSQLLVPVPIGLPNVVNDRQEGPATAAGHRVTRQPCDAALRARVSKCPEVPPVGNTRRPPRSRARADASLAVRQRDGPILLLGGAQGGVSVEVDGGTRVGGGVSRAVFLDEATDVVADRGVVGVVVDVVVFVFVGEICGEYSALFPQTAEDEGLRVLEGNSPLGRRVLERDVDEV